MTDSPAEKTPSPPSSDLAIIILGYNSREHYPACLDSLHTATQHAAAHPYTVRVIVVDNASTDGTPDFIRQHYPWVELIVAERNGGFSYGNNHGLRAAGLPAAPTVRYAMLLNPDTVTPPTALTALLTYADTHPNIGALGPRLVLPDGSLDKACKRGEPTPLTSLYHFSGLGRLFRHSPRFARYNMTFLPDDQTADVDSTVGACTLYRASVLQHIGLMDETFFMYGEDLDYNLRVRQAGYRVVYYPAVTVQHLKGAASRKAPEKMIRAFYDAMKIFHRKHYAAHYPAPFNWLVYTAVDLLCAYKLWRNRRLPETQRVVGSARPTP